MQISGLTRQETIALTGVTSGKLSRYDKEKIIVPVKFGNPQHPSVFYTWKQAVQIKLIDKIRHALPLKYTPIVLKLLDPLLESPEIFDGELVFLNKEVILVTQSDWQSFGHELLRLAKENKGKVLVQRLPILKELLNELQRNKHKIMDYDKRVVGTLLDVKSICFINDKNTNEAREIGD